MTDTPTADELRIAAKVLRSRGLPIATLYTHADALEELAEQMEQDETYLTELARHQFEIRQDERQREQFDPNRITSWDVLKREDQKSIVRGVEVLLDKLEADGRYVKSPEPVAGKNYESWKDVPPGYVYHRVSSEGHRGFKYYNLRGAKHCPPIVCSYPEGHSMIQPSDKMVIHAVTTGEVVPL